MKALSFNVTLRLTKLLNVLLMVIPFMACWCGWYADRVYGVERGTVDWVMAAVFIFLYMTYGRIYESFSVARARISEMIYSQCLSLLMADVLLYLVLCLLGHGIARPEPMILVFIAQFICSVCWCTVVHIWYFKSFPPKRTAIVFDRQRNVKPLISAYGLEKKYAIRQIVTVDDCIRDDLAQLKGMEIVFLCGIHSHERNIILKYCVKHRITAYVLPRIGDVIMSGAKRIHLFHLPFLRVARYDPAPEYLLAKRLLDIVVSAAALVLLSPVLLVTAIAIWAYDGGPALYRQTRLTKDGKEFGVLKFRSMRVDAEKDGVARLSTGDQDDRITPVGRFIRKVRIDELPQLINILQGSMSLVGPRPERPEIARQYEAQLPEFSLRLQAKAGLTGYAQVYGTYNTTPYDKLQMDLMYIAQPSLLEDLRIIFATVKILFIPESTEGVAAGMETAMEKEEETV